MMLCPKCGCLSFFNSYFQKWMCNTCEHTWKEEEDKMPGLNMTIRVADIEEVKALVKSAVELEKLIEKCVYKFQIDNSVELQNLKSALDGLARLAENKLKPRDEYGQLSPPEIAAMHQDGTLCEQCGEVIGEPVGKPRFCGGCESQVGGDNE